MHSSVICISMSQTTFLPPVVLLTSLLASTTAPVRLKLALCKPWRQILTSRLLSVVGSPFCILVRDSRSLRSAVAGEAYAFDHVLVRKRLKVHLPSASKMPHARRPHVANIRRPSTAEALSREIRPCFTTRTDGEGSNEKPSLKTSVHGAAEKILGYTQRRRRDWISGRTLQFADQAARARSRNDASFHQLRKMTAKSDMEYRKKYWA
ncbi:unnamed protein product [Schistocephalus solidus]|uniref:RxLR effector candidate protein n=1 Tax=Schistocephalus solidus TaxID=70667 RepID=A0A183SWG2_SCHSO|nr:unnamed protein product [Schistocephalus solidus]